MLPICFFVVCQTLTQCTNYANHFSDFMPNTPLDQFYWTNPTELSLESNQHSLFDIMKQLDRWSFTNPAAMHFLPYYWYSQNKGCDILAKLDTELEFALNSQDYSIVFQRVAAEAIENDVVYTSLEQDCFTEPSIESANVVVNLPRYIALLNEFVQTGDSLFYLRGEFDGFLRSNPFNRALMPATSSDLTLCLTEVTDTQPESFHDKPHPFVRVSEERVFTPIKTAIVAGASSIGVF